jgi:hypothetical protein
MNLVAVADQQGAPGSPWSVLACCLDRRVLTALATIALGVLVFRPDLLLAALPVLLVAICPLSMLLMAWQMRSQHGQPASGGTVQDGAHEANLSRLEMEVAELTLQLRELDGSSAPKPTRPEPAEPPRKAPAQPIV